MSCDADEKYSSPNITRQSSCEDNSIKEEKQVCSRQQQQQQSKDEYHHHEDETKCMESMSFIPSSSRKFDYKTISNPVLTSFQLSNSTMDSNSTGDDEHSPTSTSHGSSSIAGSISDWIPMTNEPHPSLHCHNLCSRLSDAMQIPSNIVIDPKDISYCPPTHAGLQNSSPIIPKYYFTGKKLRGKLMHVDYFQCIIDDIVNLRKLSPPQKEYLKTTMLSQEEYLQLIDAFCMTMDSFIHVYQEDEQMNRKLSFSSMVLHQYIEQLVVHHDQDMDGDSSQRFTSNSDMEE